MNNVNMLTEFYKLYIILHYNILIFILFLYFLLTKNNNSISIRGIDNYGC